MPAATRITGAMPTRITLLVSLLFTATSGSLAQTALPSDHEPIDYRVSLEPTADRTILRVRMSLAGDADGVTRIALPTGRYGTPQVWRSIQGLAADGAELRAVEGEPALRDLVHEPGAAITMSYAMDRDPAADDGVAYRPSISETHFHFFDEQWRCRVLDRPEELVFTLAFDHVPDGWTVFSNLGHGPGPYRVEPADAELSAFIAGGDYLSASFEVGGKAVGVYVRASFADPQRIVETARDIVTRQGELFGGFASDFYVVSISTRAGIQAGVAIDHAFVCLVDPETSPVGLDVLIAHEVFHNWLPGTAAIDAWKAGEPIDEFRFDWFLEGFTEYMARRILLDAGRISMGDFVDRFNRDLREQALNSMRRASLDVVRRALADGVYTNAHERTSYFRGPLMALEWARQLEERGERGLADLVKAFIARASAAGGTLGEEELFELVAEFGIDGRAAYRTHIEYGDPVIPDAHVFGPGYRWEAVQVPTRDAGFDLLSSRRAGRIFGVTLDGPAYRAGLRDGMELVEVKTSRSHDQPMRVRVKDGAVERELEYLPVGPVVESGRFVLTDEDRK